MEIQVGFEPTIRVLQTPVLPDFTTESKYGESGWSCTNGVSSVAVLQTAVVATGHTDP